MGILIRLKRVLTVLILTLIIIIQVAVYNYEITTTEEMYTTKECNIYTIPNKVTQSCKTGTKLKISKCIATEEWYKVKKIENKQSYGYIQSENLVSKDNIFIDKNKKIIVPIKPDGTIRLDKELQNTKQNNSNLNYAYNYWENIPNSIQQRFKEHNWLIVLTSTNLNDYYTTNSGNTNYNKVLALTSANEQTIWIDNTQRSIRKSLEHEVGHYIDIDLGYPSKTAEFNSIYNTERVKIIDIWENRFKDEYTPQEYFADSFKLYINNDERTEQIPETIAYIEKLVNTIELD